MSEETTEAASKPEELELVSPEVDSATTEEQPSDEAQNIENDETVTREKDEKASEPAEKPAGSELEKANKAAAIANIKNRKLERKIARMEAAKIQEPTPKAEPSATPEAEIPEDLLYEPAKTVAFFDDRQQAAIVKDRKEQDEIRQADAASEKAEVFWDKSDELAASDPEYADLVEISDDVQMSGILKDRLFKSDLGAKLHKHVLSNPDVLLKINSLSLQYPRAATDEIKRIEASLSDQSKGHKSIKETAAPKPIETVGGGSGKVLTSANAGSVDEYYERRMAERRAAAEAAHAQ